MPKPYKQLHVQLDELEPWQVLAAYRLITEIARRHEVTDLDYLRCNLEYALNVLPGLPGDVEAAMAELRALGIPATVHEVSDE